MHHLRTNVASIAAFLSKIYERYGQAAVVAAESRLARAQRAGSANLALLAAQLHQANAIHTDLTRHSDYNRDAIDKQKGALVVAQRALKLAKKSAKKLHLAVLELRRQFCALATSRDATELQQRRDAFRQMRSATDRLAVSVFSAPVDTIDMLLRAPDQEATSQPQPEPEVVLDSALPEVAAATAAVAAATVC